MLISKMRSNWTSLTIEPPDQPLARPVKRPLGIGLNSLALSHAWAAIRHVPSHFTSKSISTVWLSVTSFSTIPQATIATAMLPKILTSVPKTVSWRERNSLPATFFIRARNATMLCGLTGRAAGKSVAPSTKSAANVSQSPQLPSDQLKAENCRSMMALIARTSASVSVKAVSLTLYRPRTFRFLLRGERSNVVRAAANTGGPQEF